MKNRFNPFLRSAPWHLAALPFVISAMICQASAQVMLTASNAASQSTATTVAGAINLTSPGGRFDGGGGTRTLNITALISGAGGATIVNESVPSNPGGIITFSAANSFTGNVAITGGTLNANYNQAQNCSA